MAEISQRQTGSGRDQVLVPGKTIIDLIDERKYYEHQQAQEVDEIEKWFVNREREAR